MAAGTEGEGSHSVNSLSGLILFAICAVLQLVAALYKSTLSSGTYIRAAPTLLFELSVGTETARQMITFLRSWIAPLPIAVTPLGMSSSFKFVQLLNALSPMLVKTAGRLISSRVDPSNPEAERAYTPAILVQLTKSLNSLNFLISWFPSKPLKRDDWVPKGKQLFPWGLCSNTTPLFLCSKNCLFSQTQRFVQTLEAVLLWPR